MNSSTTGPIAAEPILKNEAMFGCNPLVIILIQLSRKSVFILVDPLWMSPCFGSADVERLSVIYVW